MTRTPKAQRSGLPWFCVQKHGWLLLLPNGGFVYLPKPFFVGTDTFTYRATDGESASNVATVQITVTR